MDAVFTLPYSEFAVADLLARTFKVRDGYSVFVPASRTEKGVDLVLARRVAGRTRCLTFQIKASRTYAGSEPKRASTQRRFRHYTWLNRFEVPVEADYVVLFGLYPSGDRSGRKVGDVWWKHHIMVFTRSEMRTFMASVKTRQGKPDRMFGFGFDTAHQAFLTRGSESRRREDFSQHLFVHRASQIRQALTRVAR